MKDKQCIIELWKIIQNQEWDQLSKYFSNTCVINFHHTNEQFTLEEYVQVNSGMGSWIINVENIIVTESVIISIIKTFSSENEKVFAHAVSFFTFENGKISKIDEYWGDGGIAPQWRIDLEIGTTII